MEESDDNRDEAAASSSSASSSSSDVSPAARLTWMGSSVAVLVALLWCTFLMVRFALMWKLYRYNRVMAQMSTIQMSCFLGIEVGVLTAITLLLFLIPSMILVWTTALVFDYARTRGRSKQQLIQNGSTMARDILLTTIKSVITEGNCIAMLVTALCLLCAFILRSVLDFLNEEERI